MPVIDEVWEVLERARHAVESLDRALMGFPVSGVVGKLFARLDAVHSSGAEGATTTFTDLLEFQTSLQRARDPEDAQAVAG
ncbi:Fic/DOC family N-terminal domain-containing protein, partial [Sabulibacter ruber]